MKIDTIRPPTSSSSSSSLVVLRLQRHHEPYGRRGVETDGRVEGLRVEVGEESL